MGKNRLTTVFLIVFVDLLGFGLVLPLLPYYAKQYGASAIVVGLLVASYAAAQFIGAPLLGRWSDQYGRRPILLLSILGTAIGFLLAGLAEPLAKLFIGTPGATQNAFVLTILFISRILDGLTGGNITVAQAYISDVTDEKNRATGLGLIGAAFGFGFILGPATGGLLSGYGYAVPFFVAGAIALLNLGSVFLFLPESLTAEKRAEIAKHPRAGRNLGSLFQSFNRPRVGPLFRVRFFYAVAFSMFQSIFGLYAAGVPLYLTARQTGFVLAYVGVLAAFVQGFAIRRLSGRFEEKTMIFTSAVLMALPLLAWGFVPNLLWLLVILLPLSFGGGILNTIINSALTKAVYPEAIGGTLGISAALESLTRVIAPALGGLLLAQFGPLGPGLFCGIIMFGVVGYAWQRLLVNPDPPLADRSRTPGMTAPADALQKKVHN